MWLASGNASKRTAHRPSWWSGVTPRSGSSRASLSTPSTRPKRSNGCSMRTASPSKLRSRHSSTIQKRVPTVADVIQEHIDLLMRPSSGTVKTYQTMLDLHVKTRHRPRPGRQAGLPNDCLLGEVDGGQGTLAEDDQERARPDLRVDEYGRDARLHQRAIRAGASSCRASRRPRTR
jgi:hypothetical protein